jgi:hypothetical protein
MGAEPAVSTEVISTSDGFTADSSQNNNFKKTKKLKNYLKSRKYTALTFVEHRVVFD